MKCINGVRAIIRRMGFDVVRYRHVEKKASIRTRDLMYLETKTGNYYIPRDAHEDIIANAIKSSEIYDEAVLTEARRHIRPGGTVLDVGSNFGQMAILFGREVGPGGRVFAFEADDFIYSILEKNVHANALDQVVIAVYGAVHDRAGETLRFPEQDFARFGTYGAYGIDYQGDRGREVKSITIDSLNIEGEVCFMKVDIQGGDLFAMRGAVETIKKNRMPIIFEYEYLYEGTNNATFQDYVDFVASIGYTFKKVIGGTNYLIVPR